MKSLIFVLAISLLALVPTANAGVNSSANKQYEMEGQISIKYSARCGMITGGVRKDQEELFKIQFFEQEIPAVGGVFGKFKITDSNLLKAGEIINGEIVGIKKNKMTLQYEGLTQEAAAEKLKKQVLDKLLAMGVVIDAEVAVKSYSLYSFVRKSSLVFQEKMSLSIPGYPKPGCSSKLKIKRKLSGPEILV